MENHIDWEEQWALFAENFYDGQAHIDLSRFGKNSILKLLPGPGFGDLSHPTTSLMLELMHPYIQDADIIDIGTGSGILALASLLLGARSAVGIDIDPHAIVHAKKNNRLNRLSARFGMPSLLQKNKRQSIFLMNMILSEQRMVNPTQFHKPSALWVTSGILSSQKELYLQQAQDWNWLPITAKEKGEWVGWVFKIKPELA